MDNWAAGRSDGWSGFIIMEVQMGRVGFMGVNVSIIYCIIYVIISRDRKFIHHNCHCIFFVIFEKYLIKTSHNGAGSQVTDDIKYKQFE